MERFKLSYTRSRRQKIIMTLAGLIVFVTTYALILPAITIDTDTAEREPGIEMQSDPAEMPALSLSESAGGITVSVDAQAGVFPANTSLVVSEREENDALLPLLEATVESKVDKYEAVEIAFADENGDPVTPQSSYTVKLVSESIKGNADRALVQVAGDVATVVEDSDFTYRQVEFSADADATFAIVEKGELTSEFLTASGNVYEVTVTYDYSAQLPKDTELVVTEFPEGSEAYESSRAVFLNALDRFEQAEAGQEVFMDILDLTLWADGHIVEPAAPVQVDIKRKNLPSDFDGEDGGLLVQHLNESGDEPFVEAMDSAVLLSGDTMTASFHTESFSTYSLRWSNGGNRTVTVHYVYKDGNGYTEFPAGTPAHAPEFSSSTNYTASTYSYLIEDIPGYKYVSTHRNSVTGTAITPLLCRYNNEWRYTTNFSTDNMNTNNSSWRTLSNNNNIYVVYEKDDSQPTPGGTPTIYESETETPEVPSMSKRSDNNHDGTRTITLSVDGHANPVLVEKLADVIVIFDVSGSMRYVMDSDTEASNANDSRLNIGLDAISNLADDLLSDEYKNKDDNPQIRMSLITFSNTAQYEPLSESDDAIYKDGELWQPYPDLNFTSDADRFKSLLADVSAGGGTNWEQALKLANELPVDPGRETFVIFVTDGDPTFRVTRDVENPETGNTISVTDARMVDDCDENYYRHFSVFGHGSQDPYGYNYDAALTQAKAIVAQGKQLYGIGISNSVSKMERLTSEAGAGEGHSFIARDREDLEAAFADIKTAITGHIGWSDVSLSDGITSMTNLTAKVNVGADYDELAYRKIIKDENGNVVQTIDGWDPATEGCNYAEYNTTTGALEWNMGENFQLADNTTYEVYFKVWPNQDAIDIVTYLKNGEKTWDDLTPEEQALIEVQTGIDEETGTEYSVYTLKTNTDLSLTYTPTRYSISGGTEVLGPPVEVPVDYEVDPLVMQTMPLSIHKEFADAFGDEDGDGIGEDRPEEVKFLVFRREKGNPNAPLEPVNLFEPYEGNNNLIILNADNGWGVGPIYVAPGLKDADGKIRELGHDYFLQELDMDYHYEHDPEYINPLMEGDDEKKEGVSYDAPMMYVRDVYIRMELNGDDDMSADLTALNVVKGGINIQKHVVDANGNEIFPDDEFTIKGWILDPNNQPYLFDMSLDDRTDRSQKSSPETPSFNQHQNDPIPYHFYNAEGRRVVYKGHVPDTSDITFTIKAGEELRFPIIPIGSTYCFWEEETGMPVNYRLRSVEGIAQEKLEVSEGSGIYEFVNSPDPNKYPVVDSDNTISGSIFGNTLTKIDFTNAKINPGSIIIRKTVTKSDGTEINPDEEFTISGYIRYSYTQWWQTRYAGRSLNYIRRDKDGNVISTGTISDTYNNGNGFALLIRGGETYEILNVPNGDQYRFQENALGNDSDYTYVSVNATAVNVNGGNVTQPTVTQNDRLATGTMHSNEEHDILYTNQIKEDPTELQLLKVNRKDNAPINGVTFEIYTDADHTTPATDYQGHPIGTITTGGFADPNETIPRGYASIGNIWPGTYYLVETGPPNGFLPLSDHIIINVGNDGTVTVTNPDDAGATGSGAIQPVNGVITIVVPNTPENTEPLPSTGGIGTTLFYISGVLLLTAAALIYIFSFRRRKGGKRRPEFP